MLILTRRRQESVAVGAGLGDEVLCKVTVMEVRGGKVRLGFEGDPALPVHRWEVWERLRAAAVAPARAGPRERLVRAREPAPILARPGRERKCAPLRDGEDVPGTGVEVRANSTAGDRVA